MDTDYFFLCPECKKMTIATGSGDPADSVQCHDCMHEFNAFIIGGVGKDISVTGKKGFLINRIYATNPDWSLF